MEGVQLAGDAGSAQVGQRLGIGIGAVLANDHDGLHSVVRVGKVNGGLPFFGGAHAGDDRVERAGHHAHGQTVPFGLDDHQLLAQPFGDLPGDLHIVAIGVSAAAFDLNGILAGIGLRPVVGGIVALHAYAEGAFGKGAGAAQHHHGGKEQGKDLSHRGFLLQKWGMKKAGTAQRHSCFDHSRKTVE